MRRMLLDRRTMPSCVLKFCTSWNVRPTRGAVLAAAQLPPGWSCWACWAAPGASSLLSSSKSCCWLPALLSSWKKADLRSWNLQVSAQTVSYIAQAGDTVIVDQQVPLHRAAPHLKWCCSRLMV
jgi:hypothetical protein